MRSVKAQALDESVFAIYLIILLKKNNKWMKIDFVQVIELNNASHLDA